MEPLSPRLQAIVDLIGNGASMADIGSDHARLPLYLLQNGRISRAIATELRDGPFRRTLAAVERCHLRQQIDVRQGDGLQTLAAGEVDVVVIAGLGGDSIAAILSHDWSKAERFPLYVFQPMTKADVLRKTLAARGWPILEEKLLLDNGRYVVILVSQPDCTPYPLDEMEAEFGTEILQADDEIKRAYLFHFMQKYNKIYASLDKSARQDKEHWAKTCWERIQRLEMILDASYRPGNQQNNGSPLPD